MKQAHQAMFGRHLLHDFHGQLVVVRGNAQPKQILIVVHRLDHRAQEQQELGIFVGGLITPK